MRDGWAAVKALVCAPTEEADPFEGLVLPQFEIDRGPEIFTSNPSEEKAKIGAAISAKLQQRPQDGLGGGTSRVRK